MVLRPLCLLCVLVAVTGITDEQYYSMPRLFELDDYDECQASRGAFCVGSFHLSSQKYSRLLNMIQTVSEDKHKFNHSVVHRGYCVNTTCAHISGEYLPDVFEECVHNLTKTKYKLDAKLLSLDNCKTSASPPTMPLDVYDLIFACVAGLILIANLVGTAYELFRSSDEKPNRFLMAWSLISSWRRLTASYDKEDSRLDALTPVHGMKAMTLILVILAHSIIAHHMTYIHNPQFLEQGNRHPLSTLLYNGTTVVQTFIILSSFLLAYNVLLSLDTDPKKKLNFQIWWQMILHRIVRIMPLNMFVIGLCATWWRFSSDGPLWSSLVEAETARCRRKWWTHVLFINNLVSPDDRCLIQTWFLAVDMQLYVITSLLLIFLARRPTIAIKILATLFVLAVIANFYLAYYLNLKSILFIARPELIRAQYTGVPSFNWQYAAAWGSLPAALLGLLLAFVHRVVTTSSYQLQQNKCYRVLYRLSVPSILLWIMCGYFVRDSPSKTAVTLYTAVDRPVFSVIMVTAMLGFFLKVDRLYWHVLTWRIWHILSRMSLSVLLVHWCYNLTFLAIKTNLARVSVFEIGGHIFTSIVMTYVTSLPLYLMVEIPAQKVLQLLYTS
ncbi:O-acyltransferase like protein-like [Vanessa cardui]|uniref:O-acyltransferase like protein-like n=1 Tax=Vanessa cardui TaxID=171605 RepID=UPI001F130B3F|nr:O-acyltransferase like protein-like [Vanessa cardui]